VFWRVLQSGHRLRGSSSGALRGFLRRGSYRAARPCGGQRDKTPVAEGGPEGCLTRGAHRSGSRGARHAAGARWHLPWGSFPFGEMSTGDRCASVYLADAFRPQGFSPSRRFPPTGASWLYFTPLPPIGFEPSELFPPNQPQRLSASVALLSFSQRRLLQVAPLRPLPPPSTLRLSDSAPVEIPTWVPVRPPGTAPTSVTWPTSEPASPMTRGRPQPGSVDAGRPGEHQQVRFRTSRETPAGEDPDFRALLRLSSRSRTGTVRLPSKPMLSWPSPPPRPTSSTVGLSPSPPALPTPLRLPPRLKSGHEMEPGASGSLQPNLGATPKSHPNPLEVSHLIRLFALPSCPRTR